MQKKVLQSFVWVPATPPDCSLPFRGRCYEGLAKSSFLR